MDNHTPHSHYNTHSCHNVHPNVKDFINRSIVDTNYDRIYIGDQVTFCGLDPSSFEIELYSDVMKIRYYHNVLEIAYTTILKNKEVHLKIGGGLDYPLKYPMEIKIEYVNYNASSASYVYKFAFTRRKTQYDLLDFDWLNLYLYIDTKFPSHCHDTCKDMYRLC